MTDEPRGISVVASGEATLAPDMALVALGVTGTGPDLAPVRSDVNARTSAVLARLRELGVADGDLDAPAVAIQPEYDYTKGGQRLIGYRVTRAVTARVRDLDTLGPILDGVVAAGANEVHGAQMAASDPSVAELEALRAAVASARAKAEAIAGAAGVSLGVLLGVEEEPAPAGSPLPRGRMMAMEAAEAPTEVAAGDLTVTRRVRATFSIA